MASPIYCGISPVRRVRSILPVNALLRNKRKPFGYGPFQVAVVEAYSGRTAVFIGGIIIDPFCGVAAGGVDGDFVTSVLQLTTAPLLIHRAQNVKELTDAFRL